MTAHELAALLLTYPDLPVTTTVVALDYDGTVNDAVTGDDNVSIEIHTNRTGQRTVSIVGNQVEA
jgi:hypothetical protein